MSSRALNRDGSDQALMEAAISLPKPSWVSRHYRLLWGAVGILSFVALWQSGASLGMLDVRMTSTPLTVAVKGAQMVSTHSFWVNFGSTMRSLIAGLVIACVLGVVIGLLAGWVRALNALLEPLIAAFYAVPFVAFLPMIILWFGLGNTSRTVIVAWSAIFPVLINTMQGVQDVRADYLRVGHSFCASETQMVLGIVSPAALPYILAGLRLAIGRALVGAIVAEFFMASSGLGFFIDRQSNDLNMGVAFAAIVVVSMIGVGMVAVVRYVETRFSGWA